MLPEMRLNLREIPNAVIELRILPGRDFENASILFLAIDF